MSRAEKKLWEVMGEDLPGYLSVKNRNTIIVNAGADWEGYKNHTITPGDVVCYYSGDARNISSGCRSLGAITGDWRNINELAGECLYIFKIINKEALRREGKKCGMELRN